VFSEMRVMVCRKGSIDLFPLRFPSFFLAASERSERAAAPGRNFAR
jgi:hypothetical protein